MLRNIGLFHAKYLDQIAGREFSIPEQLDDRDSGRMPQSLEYIGLEAAKGIGHGINVIIRIFDFSNIIRCLSAQSVTQITSDLEGRLKLRRPFRVPRFHHTLSEWVGFVVNAGLVIEQMAEPRAGEELAARVPIVEDTRVAPLFLHLRARKAAVNR